MKGVVQTRLAMVAAAVLLGGLLAACGDDDGGDAGSDTVQAETTAAGAATTAAGDTTATTAASGSGEEPQSGGSFTYMHTIDVRNFDPVQSQAGAPGGEGWQRFAVFDALVLEVAGSGEIIPQTAESLESDDAVVWTLKIKPDITFSDGEAYDAEAVKFNWERIADPANTSPDASIVGQIASMEVTDPLTLVITLKAPNGQFDRIVARRLAMSIGSPAALTADPAAFVDNPVGAGPFVVKEFVRGSVLTLERNPDYWNAPMPYLDELRIVLNQDDVQRFNSLQANEATMITDNSNANINKQAKDAGFEVPDIRDNVGSFVWYLNHQSEPFSDPVARKILAHATDKQAVIDTLFAGNGTPADYLIREPSPFFDEDSPLTAYDPAEAERLLAEYGKPLEFTILVSPSRLRYAEAWQAQLSTFPDIKTTIQQIDPTQVVPTISAGQFQAVSFSAGGQDPEPDLFDHYHSAGTRNFGKFASPEMDAALETGRTSLDDAERAEAYSTVQQIVAEEVPDIWYTLNVYGYPHSDAVKDLTLGTTFAFWDRVWLDQG